MMRSALCTLLAALLWSAAATAQTTPPPAQPPAQAPPAGTAAPKPQAAPPRAQAPASTAARSSAEVSVTDQSGSGIADVRVQLSGPVTREGATARDGGLRLQGLKPGNYRLRFESPDFITLERDVTIKAGAPTEIDVALNRAPTKPKAPEPSPEPTPAPTAGRAPVAVDPNASADLVALPDWIERNLIGRGDTVKETQVGKTPVTTATVVQVREPLKDRVRNDADEMLYVIAGAGVLRAKGKDLALDAGSLVVVPRGVGYSLERRGRNPLIALSIVGK